MLFFRLPWLPERVLTQDAGLSLLRAVRRTAVQRAAFSPRDLVRLLPLWADGHSVHGGLNSYRGVRALLLDPMTQQGVPVITAPTLFLWSQQDPFGSVELTEGLDAWVPGIRVRVLPRTGHWVHQERPGEVNRRLAEFLRG